MKRELLEKIYDKSVDRAVANIDDDLMPVAWVWEEGMVLNTIKELKYYLAINHHALTLDQLAIIEDVFGEL